MAVDYQVIVDAIDAIILAKLTGATFKEFCSRTLSTVSISPNLGVEALMKLRDRYASLASSAEGDSGEEVMVYFV